MNRFSYSLILILFLGTITGNVLAQNDTDEPPRDLRFAIGFQASFPAYGPSAMFDITEALTTQVTVDPFGKITNVTLRGLYKFERGYYWGLYGFGLVGSWGYEKGSVTDNTVALGLGGGFEYDVRGLVPDLAPILFNFETGYVYTSFDEVDADYSGFLIGLGIHYQF